MQYVQQYVFAKYPEYCNGLIIEGDNKIDDDEKQGEKSSPRSSSSREPSSSLPNLDKTQLEPTSRLLDILNKKTSIQGNFISIPEIQVRNRALQSCGLTEDEYLVVFTPTVKEATFLIGESYPFFRGNYFMTTIMNEEYDSVKGFVVAKDSKVIVAPETWLDLRIKGSQLSQYFRNRKCKYSPKGLFAYPAYVVGNNGGTRYSMHWISEARRNCWHVVLDATGVDFGKDRLGLALHRPDFVLCTVENAQYGQQPCKITCLLVRKMSFDTVTATSSGS